MISTDLLLSQNQVWYWQGFSVRYQTAGTQGPVMVLIHGFGASSDHWRKNIPVLAQTNRVYALDLIGFGQSAKPEPGILEAGKSIPYGFEIWGAQVEAFIKEVVKEEVFLVGNSIGCVVALQVAASSPECSLGTILLNCALRQIHDRKVATQPLHRRLGRPLLKRLLRSKALIRWLFAQIAKPETVRKVLLQAYKDKTAVTDELIEMGVYQ
jgi:pimeloyl-ACP methyl ester carboxylesterase